MLTDGKGGFRWTQPGQSKTQKQQAKVRSPGGEWWDPEHAIRQGAAGWEPSAELQRGEDNLTSWLGRGQEQAANNHRLVTFLRTLTFGHPAAAVVVEKSSMPSYYRVYAATQPDPTGARDTLGYVFLHALSLELFPPFLFLFPRICYVLFRPHFGMFVEVPSKAV